MKWMYTYLFMGWFAVTQAQSVTDSVYTLPQAEKVSLAVIKARPLRQHSRTSNLNDVLKETSNVFIRNYGAGQLASLTVRGTSAAQSDLLWNGIKLNSPSLGQVDASLFCMGMADWIAINGTSQAANIGGSFNLTVNNLTDSATRVEAEVGYGSFNTVRAFGKLQMGNGRIAGATRVSYMQTDNNYTFTNTYKPGNPKEKLTNARVQLLHIMQQFSARINANNTISYYFWLSDAQRQIPPVISKPDGKESQDDYSIRNMLNWQGNYGKIKAGVTSAYLYDVIRYRNPQLEMDEKSVMQAWRNNVTFCYDSLNRFQVVAEAGYDYEQAQVNAYRQVRRRHIARLMAGVKYTPVRQIELLIKLRQAIYDKQLSPFAPVLTATYLNSFNSNQVKVTLNASRNFRFPTLNDLYWVPGGNPALKPENSWDGELQLYYGYQSYFVLTANAFAKYINNWIQWTNNGVYWEPGNVKRVFTRGIELSISSHTDYNRKFMLSAYTGYTYTRATNLDPLSPYDQSLNKQLIYVPLHQARAIVTFYTYGFYVKVANSYTGAVYITTDNTQQLKGYYLLDLELGKDLEIHDRYFIGLALRVNNATNQQYQNVAQRPMPGINFEGALKFRFSR